MSTKTTKRKRATATAPGKSPEAQERPMDGNPSMDSPVASEPTPAVSANAEPVVSLFSNSTVKDAAALQGTLQQVLDAPGSVTIDAKSVERIDTAIIQLLCAFVRDRAERKLAVVWHGTSQPLFDAARLLGVGTLLALPSQAET